jgi:hypothetical protein
VSIISTLLGVVLIVLVLHDIFHTLFDPTGRGTLSSHGALYVWRGTRRIASHRPQVLPLAGPLALIAVIMIWTLVLAIGWALIYWPYLPEGFVVSPGLDPDNNGGLLDALYVSLVTLATLGYGEITPLTPWLRMAGPLEALVGFALITASISWILSVYPVLGRRRQLAREITLLVQDSIRLGPDSPHDESAALDGVLHSLAEQVIAVCNDLEQFPITYYFHPANPDSALSVVLPGIVGIARRGEQDGSAAVRLQSRLLLQAVDELATHVADTFLKGCEGNLETLLAAWSADHRYGEQVT